MHCNARNGGGAGTEKKLGVFFLRINLTQLKLAVKLDTSYLFIKAAKSYFDEPREKLSPRPLAAETRQFRGRQRIS
jgi:hypothetical protein